MTTKDHAKYGDKPCPSCGCPNNYDVFGGCYWCLQCGSVYEIFPELSKKEAGNPEQEL